MLFLERQREQGRRCGVSAPIPSGKHLLLHPSPLFCNPTSPQSYLQHEGTTRKRSDQNESGAQKYTAEEAAEGESQGLESRDQGRRERPVLGLELQQVWDVLIRCRRPGAEDKPG